MDAKGLLDLVLRSGKELANEGSNKISEVAGTATQSDDEQAAMLKGAGTGAAAAGLAALLLGTKGGRKMAKYGTLAALGAVAYRSFKNYKEDQNPVIDSDETVLITANESEGILSAMIAAAKADGRIDGDEQAALDKYLNTLGESEAELKAFVTAEIEGNSTTDSIAAKKLSEAHGHQMYLAALLAINVDTMEEMQWLEDFAQALGITPEQKRALEAQAKS